MVKREWGQWREAGRKNRLQNVTYIVAVVVVVVVLPAVLQTTRIVAAQGRPRGRGTRLWCTIIIVAAATPAPSGDARAPRSSRYSCWSSPSGCPSSRTTASPWLADPVEAAADGRPWGSSRLWSLSSMCPTSARTPYRRAGSARDGCLGTTPNFEILYPTTTRTSSSRTRRVPARIVSWHRWTRARARDLSFGKIDTRKGASRWRWPVTLFLRRKSKFRIEKILYLFTLVNYTFLSRIKNNI